ncbi:ephrin type-B receptor 1-B-like isoform X2 [Lineus longissimus]|uniref:ephrin type-B receptor 1-B-like isoform X2 n=1 Tax=Lineus longissimus TaxID=88925 RepID=UPI002B4CC6E7
MAAGMDAPPKLAWILSFLCGLFTIIYGNEVVLLDTTKEESLDWQTYPQNKGWKEASYNMATDMVKVYAVCDVSKQNVNNWLRTPYIPGGVAQRLYIEMKFTMRECTRYPSPDNLQQCKETFHLMYYEAESDFANEMMPTWDTRTYRHIDAVAADYKFSDTNDAKINTETRSIMLSRMRKGVYFAFQDTGACTSLIAVRIYYIFCPEITINFATFPDTPTGPEPASIEQTSGQCVANGAMFTQPSYLCKADGTWYLNSGRCQCMAGYQPETPQSDRACIDCPINTYKWNVGSDECRPCPDKSYTDKKHSVECKCIKGYYRSRTDPPSRACARPPTSPRNLTIMYSDERKAMLRWLPPLSDGGRNDLFYHVHCWECDGAEKYSPTNSGFNQTSVTIEGLDPSTSYTFAIYARNGISAESGSDMDHFVMTKITTDAAVPSKVEGVEVLDKGLSHITLAWRKPNDKFNVDQYEVKYFPADRASNASSIQTEDVQYQFQGLREKTRFGFQVRGKTIKGWGLYSDTLFTTTENAGGDDSKVTKVNPVQDASPIGIIAGSIVAVFVCLAIVIIMVVILLRKNNRACNEKNPADCETLQYSNAGADLGSIIRKLTVPLFTHPGSVRTYIDPHTYEDPNQAVREFTKEIDASHITIESVIGGGEFGDVCKGMLRIPGKLEMSVAIKTLKPGASEKNRLDFLTEASIMGQFEDANVIYLEGVVTKSKQLSSNPIMIVTEYMENGSLDTFLRNNDGQFTVMQLTGMLRGIAAGMKYLSEMGYVHRDLAARNILVNENLVCKVADFGLSREIESDTTDGAYTTKGGKIPVRWTAPEAIAYRKFTSASDVWSYAVVMWEVMSYGERPYWNWSNQDVIKAVEKGYRLPPPMDCPEAIHQLMLDCWQKERSHRPKFAAIVRTLDKLIRAPELLRKVAKARPHNIFDPSLPDMTRFETIEEWLTSIKMDRYIDSFLQSGYSSMDLIAKITIKDLINMGITLVGHQKKIMNSVQTLRAQISGGAQVSEGFLV